MTDKEIEELIEESLKEVESLYEANLIKLNDYHKCLTCFAYEYAFLDKISPCLNLLKKCGKIYFKTVFKQQMEEDELFYKVGTGLKQRLTKFNIIEFDFMFIDTYGSN